MTTKYDILKNEVAPILQDTGNLTNSLLLTGKNVQSQLEDALGACRLPLVTGALRGYEASVTDNLQNAVSLAGSVVMAAATATRAYILADYHMTQQVHQDLQAGIPNPRELKLEQQQ